MGILNFFKKEPELKLGINDVEDIGNKYYYHGELYTGKLIEYDGDGNIEAIISCKKGNIISPLKQYYSSGSIELIRNFNEKGAISETGYAQSGEINYEIKYINGRKIKRIDYFPSGKIKKVKSFTYVERYDDDVPHGDEITYDENGSKTSESLWEYGFPNGRIDF